ncbi:MAG: ribosome biogenesis GTPase Der [Bowdeniella nasicola]|nr:ribosome biogenesis GTPase Der [Bowdeniella nasicola]
MNTNAETPRSQTDPQFEDNRADALRASLADYDLDAEDEALLAQQEAEGEETLNGAPVVAVVGRPNVGKSTLVNRIIGYRAAVVQDTPGVTRDRVSYPAEWNGRPFTLVDTGGWEVDVMGLDASVANQAEIAVQRADAVIFVVDATVGATDTDERVVRMLRRAGKPVILAANKVDSAAQESDAAMLWSLGLGEPYPVSGLHGRGSGDLLDALLEVLPETSAVATAPPSGGPRRVALVGRPNVGKSSLLNKLAGEGRVVVDDTPGTTRDPVDELIEIDGRPWWFVDTAGIRRRVHQSSGADFYAVLRTQQALEKAEVAVVLIDATEPMTEQDIRVIQLAIDAGRALVVVLNKWDEMDDERREVLARELDLEFVRLEWAPVIRLSAKSGWHLNRLTRALDVALESWDTRISTGRFNAFLGELTAANPHPVRGGKQPRILFGTQIGTRPPRFVLFTTGFLEAGYRRFIERQLRETFGFEGSPIQISVRVREKRRH